MRTLLLPFLALPLTAIAQCPFNPTIEPSAPTLCPGEQLTLTTQVYDSYQWLKDGEPIDGAVTQTWTVDYTNDGGSMFTVSVTDDGCTEASPGVLIDGRMFLPLYVIHGGDEPFYTGGEGQPYFCEGQLLTLTIGMSSAVNITWYRDGEVIPGENGLVLEITTSGNYTCSASPDICPNSVLHLGVDVAAIFEPNLQPVITLNDAGELCATPMGNSYAWYLDGSLLAGSDAPCIVYGGSGDYTVFVDYDAPCQVISEPFIPTGVVDRARIQPSLSPNPADDQLRITGTDGLVPSAAWTITDVTGRRVATGRSNNGPQQTIDIASLGVGTYLLQFQGAVPLRFIKR